MSRDRHPTIIESHREEKEVVKDLIDRSVRGVEISKILDAFVEREDLDVPDRVRVSKMLERVGWGRIFTDLRKGDTVLTFLTPGPKFLSIKYLNDEIFGETTTNEIIVARRKVVEELVAATNERVEEEYRISALDSNYKVEAMRIPNSSPINESAINQIMEEVDRRMTAKIQTILAEVEAGQRTALADENKLKEFKDALEGVAEHAHGKSGFKMNYGLAIVETEDAEGKIGALAKSLQASRIARGRHHGPEKNKYGAEYDQQEVLSELETISRLRKEIIDDPNHNNIIVDREGNEFKVFERRGSAGAWEFNRDLLREIRKEKFKVNDEMQAFLEKIILYTKKINIIDMVKPFVYEEAASVEAKVTEAHRLRALLDGKQPVSKDEREKIAQVLRSDGRAEGFTSKIEFDRRAVDMQDAVYISMDVLDLGVDLLLEFEAGVQQIEQETDMEEKIKKFKTLSLSAGDTTTKDKLREFWQSVKGVLNDKKLCGNDGLFTAYVKGDEIVLAVEMGEGEGKIRREDIGDLLFDLKRETNSRVIETRISETEKHVHTTNQTRKVEAHLQAIKRSEFGVAILKEIEEVGRKMTLLLRKNQGAEIVNAHIEEMYNIFTVDDETKIVKANVVVVQNRDEFNVVKGVGRSVKYSELKVKLDTFLSKK